MRRRKLPALVFRSLRRSRGLLISLGGVLATFQVLVVIAASYLREQRVFSQVVAMLPPFAQQFFGAFLTSYTGMVAFGYWHPVVVIAFVGVGIVVASEPAADRESGVVDLVLARPVARRAVITRSVLVTMLTTVAFASLMVTTTTASLLVAGGPSAARPALTIVARLAANLVAVSWCLGALALAASTVLRGRGTAAGVAGLAAFAAYLLNVLGDASSRFRPYALYSPFHYFQPIAVLSGGSRWRPDVALLVSVAAVLTLAAYAAWSRRDL